jgi:bile acid-coenzyme A ligase
MNRPSTSADERLAAIAREDPARPALIVVGARTTDTVVTWAELDEASADLAERLRRLASGTAAVVIDATNSVDTVVGFAACMRAEVPFLPLDPFMPPAEVERVLDALARTHRPVRLEDAWGERPAQEPPAGADPAAGYLLATGGSSGSPRLIRHPRSLRHDPALVPNPMLRAVGWRHGQRQLIAGPLHHAAPFMCCWEGLLDANTLVLMPRFDARAMLRAIDRRRIEWAQLTPTHLQWAAHASGGQSTSFGSLRAIVHTAAPCPEALKRTWIDLVGPERLYEIYGATEAIGTTLLDGREWLAHPGSVGRGFCTQLRILDEDGRSVPIGVEGEVFMKRPASGRDRGGHGLKRTVDGFLSVGDHGRLDRDGYLYLGPRRHDMVIVGGGNVYPAEVEAVIMEHPGVLDVAITGIPDDLLGERLEAFVVTMPGFTPTADQISAHAESRLAPHKVPWSVRFVRELPRTPAGKLHRHRITEMEVPHG